MRFWYLVLREASGHFRSLRFRVMAATSVLLAVLAINVGARDYQFRLDQFNRHSQQREIDRTKSSAHLMGWSIEPSLRALRRPSPNSIFVQGLDAEFPTFWDFGPAGTVEGTAGPRLVQSAAGGSLVDLEALVRVVLGLLAVLLALETVAGDRTTGALHALMSQPVSSTLVVTGKLLGAVLALSVALAVTSAAGLASLWAQASDLVSPQIVQTLLVLDLASLGYLCSMVAGGMVIGALVRRYETGLMVGLAAWAYVALIAPQLVAFGTGALSPVLPRQVAELERQTLFSARLRSTEENLGSAYRRLYGEPKSDLTAETPAPIREEMDRLWRADAAETRQIVEAIDHRAADEVAEQRAVMAWLSRTNPGTLFLAIATNIADVGWTTQAHWETDVDQYQRLLNDRLFDDRARVTLRVPTGKGQVREFVGFDRRALFGVLTIPSFVAQPRPLSTRLRAAQWDVVVLAACMIALLAAAYVLFPKTGL